MCWGGVGQRSVESYYAKMSILVWHLFHDRLPTKYNFRKRGVQLNSTSLCVGGCSCDENARHIFFNYLMLSIVWIESLKWLGVSTAFLEGGFDHLKMFSTAFPVLYYSADGMSVCNNNWSISFGQVSIHSVRVHSALGSSLFAASVASQKALSICLGSESILTSSALELFAT
jgi:hypothetical protein